MKCTASLSVAASLLMLGVAVAHADERHLSFAYELTHDDTAYGYTADVFGEKLAELSGGTLVIDQFPGAQLGSEPQMLERVRSGDIDLIITSTASAATVEPQIGALSIHYLFESEAHLSQAIADPSFVGAVRDMFAAKVPEFQVLDLITLGLRNIYGRKEVHSPADIAGVKMRVQATPTEDTLWAAYGAQTVHMPFGEVYTSMQTGVVELAENSLAVIQTQKHYEVGPIVSMTQHESSNSMILINTATWNSLTPEQQGWVQQAADETAKVEPQWALDTDHKALETLKGYGVKIVDDVDKDAFVAIAAPIQDKIAADLGPDASKLLDIVRKLKP